MLRLRPELLAEFSGDLTAEAGDGAVPAKRFWAHWDGVNRSRLGRREGISGATVKRWFEDYLRGEDAERQGSVCPRVLGIDEHFFWRKDGYVTTFCDLRRHTIFDVVVGRSEATLEDYLAKLPGKERVRVVCMDLSSVYHSLVHKYFPNARIVADRFHVIRLINHHFLACWREIDPVGSKHCGLLSRMRRHWHNLKPEQQTKLESHWEQFPALREIYRFKQMVVAVWDLMAEPLIRRRELFSSRVLARLHEPLRESWQTTRVNQGQEFVIGGYTPAGRWGEGLTEKMDARVAG